jgi:serine phosphatase RsbU (regulator of sigma subunit)
MPYETHAATLDAPAPGNAPAPPVRTAPPARAVSSEATLDLLNATVATLPTVEARVELETPCEVLHRLFNEQGDLPGVIVEGAGGFCGLVSRQHFFEQLGRPFGVDVFLGRTVRTLLETVRVPPLVLPHDRLIRDATREALSRPADQAYTPLAMRCRDGRHRILDVHDLLIAQNELLIHSSQAVERQLEQARQYVMSLLPRPLTDGPVRAEWCFTPSAQLGGDMFGYHWLDEAHLAVYLLDVSGHGIGPALLSVSVLNLLQTRSLPGVDFRQPAAVLRALNTTFDHARNGSMFFTLWYGVYQPHTRRIRYASAGHPPALVVPPDRAGYRELRTRAPAIGMVPGAAYFPAEETLEPGARLYLYSDGAYEVYVTPEALWTLSEFKEVVAGPTVPHLGEADRLEREVRRRSITPALEDDFSLVVFTLP